jgi:tetratricopeptide (TPR) repeat protein
MATRATRRGRREDDDTARDQWTEADEPEDGETERDRRGETRQLARAAPQPARRALPGDVFDPTGAIRVGLLRLARNWKDAGSTYQAIHAYTELLSRYPRTGAANAAVEELLEMAESLARQGKYFAALNIFNKLEQLY